MTVLTTIPNGASYRDIRDTINAMLADVAALKAGGSVSPALALSGPLAFASGAAPGTLVATIGNVPAGATPTLTPNDGRLVVAGSQNAGWTVVVGLTASSAGTIALSVAAAGATAASATVTVSAAGATALPQQSAIARRWLSDAIPAQADNTALASWADTIGGEVITAPAPANRPTYRTNGQNGKPYIDLRGAHWFDGATDGVFATTLQGNCTALFFVRNVQQVPFGYLMSLGEYNTPSVAARTTEVGGYNSAGCVDMDAGTGFCMLGIIRADQTRGVLNGTVSIPTYYGQAPAGSVPRIGGQPDFYGNVMSAKLELYEAVIWNRTLTQPELLQAMRYGCDHYNIPYPWAASPTFDIYETDSIGCDYNGTTGRGLHSRVAKVNGRKSGTYTHVGYVGKHYGHMKAEAPTTVDPIKAQVGSVATRIWVMEYANIFSLSEADAINEAAGYIAARKAAGHQLVFGTSTDMDGSQLGSTYSEAKRLGFSNNDWIGAGADVVLKVHENAKIGVDGTNPGANFSDAYHPNDAGYAELLRIVAPVMA